MHASPTVLRCNMTLLRLICCGATRIFHLVAQLFSALHARSGRFLPRLRAVNASWRSFFCPNDSFSTGCDLIRVFGMDFPFLSDFQKPNKPVLVETKNHTIKDSTSITFRTFSRHKMPISLFYESGYVCRTNGMLSKRSRTPAALKQLAAIQGDCHAPDHHRRCHYRVCSTQEG